MGQGGLLSTTEDWEGDSAWAGRLRRPQSPGDPLPQARNWLGTIAQAALQFPFIDEVEVFLFAAEGDPPFGERSQQMLRPERGAALSTIRAILEVTPGGDGR